MSVSTYPEDLKELGLSFEESVYAIAFNLKNDIRLRGKEAIFRELPCREQMAENIQKTLAESGYAASYAYALQRALGYPTYVGESIVYDDGWRSMDQCLRSAMNFLCNNQRWNRSVPRCLLLGKAWAQAQCDTVAPQDGVSEDVSNPPPMAEEFFSVQPSLATSMPDLYAQLQQLAGEVRFYNRKRDQALAAIEALLTEVKHRVDALPALTAEALAETSPNAEVDSQGSITQLPWSYRNLHVLQELKIETLAEAVEYFSDFDNFVKGDEITLWEWSTIIMTLQRAGLWSAEKTTELHLEDKIENIFFFDNSRGLDVRVENCLRRNDIVTVGDLICKFAGGADEGWSALPRLRNFGRGCNRHLVEFMTTWIVEIPAELCNPTKQSSVQALDFEQDDLHTLQAYGLKTIGELVAVCENRNRFCGLRYFDPKLYDVAVGRLKAYGFWQD